MTILFIVVISSRGAVVPSINKTCKNMSDGAQNRIKSAESGTVHHKIGRFID